MSAILISIDSELFGTENGIGPERTTASSRDGFLAMVKDQTEDRRTKKQAAEQVVEPAVEPAGEQAPPEEQGKCFGLYTSDSDMHQNRPVG